MDAKRINEALEVLNWLADRTGELPEEQKEALKMRLTLQMAGLFLVEYLSHTVRDGMDPYDALLATARGEMKLPEQQADVLRAVIPNPNAPEGPGRTA